MPPIDGTEQIIDAQNNTVDTDNVEVEDSISTVTYDIEDNWEDISGRFDEGVSTSQMDSILTNLSGGIFGMPYQFMKEVDPVVPGTEYGAKYLQKITSVMPVMFICPGEPAFMPGYSTEDRRTLMNFYDEDSAGDLTLNDIFDGKQPGKFYTFNSTFGDYCKYVNVEVQALSNLMGLGDEKYYDGSGPWSRLKNFDLNSILNKEFQQLFNANTSVAFYLDAETSVSESFGNSTTESMLSSKVNQLSDAAKEVNFLTNSIGAGGIYDAVSKVGGGIAEALAGGTESIPLVGGIMDKIAYSLNTIVSGGKMIFPEIWASSEYSRNYSITLKLRSPDPDPLSILLNIYIPLCCLTALTMPKQMGADANGYVSPFLVRATYKSIFNCELGMITSLDIQKGGEDKWNALGMPTAVDVTVTIKDLYSTMFMSGSITGLMNNTSQLDYLSLMAGLDMNKDWLARRAKLYLYLLTSTPITAVPMAWNNFKSAANKTAGKYLSKILGADTRFTR